MFPCCLCNRNLCDQKSVPPTKGRRWCRWDCIHRQQRMMYYLSLWAHVIKQGLRDLLAVLFSETKRYPSRRVQVSGRCLWQALDARINQPNRKQKVRKIPHCTPPMCRQETVASSKQWQERVIQPTASHLAIRQIPKAFQQ